MATTRRAPREAPLTREAVLDAATALVRRRGVAALTMRALAAELGTAVTAIYWHVGNREALLDELVARTVRELGRIRARGRTPAERAESLAHALRRELLGHPNLIALVHERGLTELMMLPAQRALAEEAHAAGLRGARAAEAVRAVQVQVIGHVLVARARERAPEQRPDETELWAPESSGQGSAEAARAEAAHAEAAHAEKVPPEGKSVEEGPHESPTAVRDPGLAAALAAPLDEDAVFTLSVRALVRSLWGGEG